MKKRYVATALVATTTACATMGFTPTHADAPETAVDNAVIFIEGIYQSAIDAYNAEHPESVLQLVEVDSNTGNKIYYQPEQLKAVIPLNRSSGYQVKDQNGTPVPLGEMDGIIDSITRPGDYLNYYPYDSLEYGIEFYNRDGVFCVIGQSEFSCGHSSWHTTPTAAWKEFLDGVGEAYSLKNHVFPRISPSYDISDDTQLPEVVNSDYSPYQHTEMGIENAVGLFYRQSPTSEWIFFTATQMAVNCNNFTGEAQKGFAGGVCYDDASNQIAKVVVATADAQEAAPETAQEDAIKTPNTGSPTLDDKGVVAGISAASIAAIAILYYCSRHISSRRKTKVRFGKH